MGAKWVKRKAKLVQILSKKEKQNRQEKKQILSPQLISGVSVPEGRDPASLKVTLPLVGDSRRSQSGNINNNVTIESLCSF